MDQEDLQRFGRCAEESGLVRWQALMVRVAWEGDAIGRERRSCELTLASSERRCRDRGVGWQKEGRALQFLMQVDM